MQSKLRPVLRASRFDAVVIHLGDNDCCSLELSPLGLASCWTSLHSGWLQCLA